MLNVIAVVSGSGSTLVFCDDVPSSANTSRPAMLNVHNLLIAFGARRLVAGLPVFFKGRRRFESGLVLGLAERLVVLRRTMLAGAIRLGSPRTVTP